MYLPLANAFFLLPIDQMSSILPFPQKIFEPRRSRNFGGKCRLLSIVSYPQKCLTKRRSGCFGMLYVSIFMHVF
ncbi:MAG: hypothetical protein B7Y44_07085 [Sphingomonadales bacterium 28-55-16]|nr:MAG: hypothetical protein B7Y44_07085 [Sphingomonadales bacterium 28-55-16]